MLLKLVITMITLRGSGLRHDAKIFRLIHAACWHQYESLYHLYFIFSHLMRNECPRLVVARYHDYSYVRQQVRHDLGMEDSLSKKQFGFKKGTSTETALHKVIHKIEKRIAKKGYVLGTFLDIEGAFDNVSFKAISEAIDQSPLDSSTAGWIKNMVTNRHVTITHKNATRRIKTKRGCPQGGVLSPFLWNLVIDDLLHYTAKHIPGYIQAFADDIMSLAEGDDLDVIWQRTQTTIKTIENWCQSKGLNNQHQRTQNQNSHVHMEQKMVPAPHKGLRGDNRTQQRS